MKYIAAVRYGTMGYVGKFSTEVIGLKSGETVIARTDRGVESGQVISPCEVLPDDADPKQIPALVGEILRRVTPNDQEKIDTIENELQPGELKFCQKRFQERGLRMKLACVEHLFGGTKIIFYFLADGRIDFRELVKDLAQEYHCRIEMRQIGVRDEARLLADYEHCGRPLCCRTFVKKLEPVTMKMAKSQKATLDPAKISGRCGRLMCCLRFEDAVYVASKKRMPSRGTRVSTDKTSGVVVDYNVLCELVKIETDAGERETISVDDITNVAPSKSGRGNSGRDRKRRPDRQESKPESGGRKRRSSPSKADSPKK